MSLIPDRESVHELSENHKKHREFIRELTGLLSKYGKELPSNTPDYVLAEFLALALDAFTLTLMTRDMELLNESEQPKSD